MAQISKEHIEEYSSFNELLTQGMPFGAIKNITQALGPIDYNTAEMGEICNSVRGLLAREAALLAYHKYRDEIRPLQAKFYERCIPRMACDDYQAMIAGMVFAKLCQDCHKKYVDNKKTAQQPPVDHTIAEWTALRENSGRG